MSSDWVSAVKPTTVRSKNKFNRPSNSSATNSINKVNPGGLSKLQSLSSINSKRKGGLFNKRKVIGTGPPKNNCNNNINNNDASKIPVTAPVRMSPEASTSDTVEEPLSQKKKMEGVATCAVVEDTTATTTPRRMNSECKRDEDLDLDEVLFSVFCENQDDEEPSPDPAAAATKEARNSEPEETTEGQQHDFSWENIIVQHKQVVKAKQNPKNAEKSQDKDVAQKTLSVLKTRQSSSLGNRSTVKTLQPLSTKRRGKSRIFGPKQQFPVPKQQEEEKEEDETQEQQPQFDSWVQETVAFLNLSILPQDHSQHSSSNSSHEDPSLKLAVVSPLDPFPAEQSESSPSHSASCDVPTLGLRTVESNKTEGSSKVVPTAEDKHPLPTESVPIFMHSPFWAQKSPDSSQPCLTSPPCLVEPNKEQDDSNIDNHAVSPLTGAEHDTEMSVCTNEEDAQTESEPVSVGYSSDATPRKTAENSSPRTNNPDLQIKKDAAPAQDSRRVRCCTKEPHVHKRSEKPKKDTPQRRQKQRNNSTEGSSPSENGRKNNNSRSSQRTSPRPRSEITHPSNERPKSRRRPRPKKLPVKSETRFALEQLQPAAPPVPKPAVPKEELARRLFEMGLSSAKNDRNVDGGNDMHANVSPTSQPAESTSVVSLEETPSNTHSQRELQSESKQTKSSFAAAVRAETRFREKLQTPSHPATKTAKTPLLASTTAIQTTPLALQQLSTKRRGTSRLLGSGGGTPRQPKVMDERSNNSSWNHPEQPHCRLVLLSN